MLLLWYNTGMTEEQKKGVADIAEKHGLALVVLFGSRARGDRHTKSDADVAYSSLSPLSFNEENTMAVAFHEVFKTIKVDVVNLHNAGPLLLKRIVEEGAVLYEARQSIFNSLYLYAVRIFRESKMLNTLRRAYVLHTTERYKKDVAFNR